MGSACTRAAEDEGKVKKNKKGKTKNNNEPDFTNMENYNKNNENLLLSNENNNNNKSSVLTAPGNPNLDGSQPNVAVSSVKNGTLLHSLTGRAIKTYILFIPKN